MDGPRDRDRRDDEAGDNGSELLKAEGRPDQRREEEMRVAPLAGKEDDRADPDQDAQEDETLQPGAIPEPAPGPRQLSFLNPGTCGGGRSRRQTGLSRWANVRHGFPA